MGLRISDTALFNKRSCVSRDDLRKNATLRVRTAVLSTSNLASFVAQSNALALRNVEISRKEARHHRRKSLVFLAFCYQT